MRKPTGLPHRVLDELTEVLETERARSKNSFETGALLKNSQPHGFGTGSVVNSERWELQERLNRFLMSAMNVSTGPVAAPRGTGLEG